MAIPSPPIPVFYSSLYYIPHSTLSSLMPLHTSSFFLSTSIMPTPCFCIILSPAALSTPYCYSHPSSTILFFHLVFILFSYCSLSVPTFSLIPLLSSFYRPSSSTFLFPSLSSFFASSQNEKDPGLTLLLSRVFSKKGGGFLLSHIALQYHRRKRA